LPFQYTHIGRKNHITQYAKHLPHFLATNWRGTKQPAILEGNEAYPTSWQGRIIFQGHFLK
ncbi:hypothetical protein STEG23_029629, partial [Scotinomys teguina]